ncbi:MAG: carbon-nitrogen hydrolase family protein [Syntrophomonadaceae bacterium]|nr:carbon-nitrogen hydrolase family protein [Syntrophomonadaceae bacterium]
MKKIKLAMVQFLRQSNDWKTNFSQMAQYLKNLTPEVDIVALPEGWLGTQPMSPEQYEEIMQELFTLVSRKCLMASGAQYLKVGQEIYCRGLLLSPDRSAPIPVEKLFPSQAVGERSFVTPGTALPVVQHQGIHVGVAVCVDLFYPEVVRNLALRGAVLVLNPVNIPEPRIPLWQQLSMTRACENTIFVAMVNNTGTRYPDGRNIQGDSFVAYPDGYKLRSFGPEAGVYYVDLDLDLITKVRKRWPYLEDMRQGRPVLPLP